MLRAPWWPPWAPNNRSGKLSDNLIEVRDVDFSRGSRPIFSNLGLTIARGKVTAIMGPSGTGKTTLLQLITRQLNPDRGQIIVAGDDIAKFSISELYKMRKRFGMLFQNGALLTDMSVFENVAFPLREHTNLGENLVRNVVLMKLHSVGLRGAAYMMPSELSGGMARRVALARAIVMDPAILIYDEPFVGLDPISMGVIGKLIRQLNTALGITSIVVSHDVKEIGEVADYSYVIADGRVAASGRPCDLKNESSELVRQFMLGLADGPVAFHYDAPDYAEQILGKSPD